MAFSQPSSPVLKARRQKKELCSRVLYAVCVFISAIWFIRYVLLDVPPRKGYEKQPQRPFAKPSTAKLSATGPEALSNPPPALSNISSAPNKLSSKSDQHGISLPIDSHYLSAVLPVTPHTVNDLGTHLHLLLDHPGALSEIVIVIPLHLHPAARRTIQAILSYFEDFDIEVSLSPWPGSVPQDIAVVQVAQRLSADWVLLLDLDGLKKHDLPTRESLLLHRQPHVAAAIGPRGVDYHLDGVTCIANSPGSRRAAYLVPPLVLPMALLPQHLDTVSAINTWSALGDYISRSDPELRRTFVVDSHSPADTTAEWCSRYAPLGLDGTRLRIYDLDEHLQAPVDHSEYMRGIDSTDTNHTGTVLFAASTDDMPYLQPLACELLRQGHDVALLLLDNHSSAIDTNCAVPVRSYPWSLPGSRLNVTPPLSADSIPENIDVLLSTGESHVLAQLSAILIIDRPLTTHIHIPRDDLPYTDWMVALNLEELKNWHTPRIELSVITNDRPYSLRRLLSSLSSTRYFGDTLDLRINLEHSADVQTLRLADEYAWPHGSVFVHHRIIHGGLLPAVVESWYPRGNDSYGVILEDDVELSPLFYAYLKLSLLRYRYGKPEDRSPNLFGISLYQQKNLELRPEGRHSFDARALFAAAGLAHPHTPYLSQIPCSWGALYFPEHWREFHAYLGARLAGLAWPLSQTVVPGVRSNRWTRSWKRYFIELAFLRGYVMLYPNYRAFASLSTNHLEVGSHVRDVPTDAYLRKKRLFDLPLMPLPPVSVDGKVLPDTGLLELPDGKFPTWSELPVLDLLGAIVDYETILQRGVERRTELTGCGDAPSQPFDAGELLCTG
ncbi:hypothetical protein C8Q77DRAFT_1212698 [Trametes polyzona]|nr:hypothetical protein C8Q77DRAFT_1212698 [Trametes polyzona]